MIFRHIVLINDGRVVYYDLPEEYYHSHCIGMYNGFSPGDTIYTQIDVYFLAVL